jgi:transposase
VDKVIIGAGPHKLSVTFEARDTREILRASGRFGTDTRGYRLLVAYVRQWPERGVGGGRRERDRVSARPAAAR